MKNRIQTIIHLEKMSASQMASLLGIQRSTLSNITSGRNKPSFDILQSILTKFPNLNFDWLMLGKGNPYKDSTKNLRGLDISETNIENLTNFENEGIGERREEELQKFSDNPENDFLLNSFDNDFIDFGGDNKSDSDLLFPYLSDNEEKNNSSPTSAQKEYHPYPAVESGELGKQAKILQDAKNKDVTPQNTLSEPSENRKKITIEGDSKGLEEKKIKRILIFYEDGTFEEVVHS